MVLVKFLKKKFEQFLEEYLEVDPQEKKQMNESLKQESKPKFIKSIFSKKKFKKNDKQFEKLLSFKQINVKCSKFADMLKDLPVDLKMMSLHELVIDIPWKNLFSKSVEIKVFLIRSSN
jgi:hypothetical protein